MLRPLGEMIPIVPDHSASWIRMQNTVQSKEIGSVGIRINGKRVSAIRYPMLRPELQHWPKKILFKRSVAPKRNAGLVPNVSTVWTWKRILMLNRRWWAIRPMSALTVHGRLLPQRKTKMAQKQDT